MIAYRQFGIERIEEVYRIYEENGWTSYLGEKEKLIRAFERSSFLLGAFDEDRLIGFVRCVDPVAGLSKARHRPAADETDIRSFSRSPSVHADHRSGR